MPDKEKYENDVHNCTNPQLADLLDKIAEEAARELRINRIKYEEEVIEIVRHQIEILTESAKRLRIRQRELFNHEAFSV